jgi:hypothetical protein
MNCSSDCDRGTCPFVSDPNSPNRYVCLKCGLERDISDSIRPDPFFLFLLTLLLGTVLIMSQRSPASQPDPAPVEFPSP